MAKIDKSKYTKAQWKIIREQRRQEKIAKLQSNTVSIPNNSKLINDKISE